MTFQTAINITQALAVDGQFASTNPRRSLLSVEGGFKAGAGGVFIAQFAWVDATNTLLSGTGAGLPSAFIANVMTGFNGLMYGSGSPGGATFFIPSGFPVGNAFTSGDFWVRNRGAGAVVVGMKAFAGNTNNAGTQFAAAGATIANFTETKFIAATAGGPNELIKMSSGLLG